MIKNRKIEKLFITLSAVISLCGVFPCTQAYAATNSDVILDVPWNYINNCGHQAVSGPCQAYCWAYCRIILDNSPHTYRDYYKKNEGGVAPSAAGYNNRIRANSTLDMLRSVYENINLGRPVMIGVRGSKKTDGTYRDHFVVAIGYKAGTDPNNLKTGDILILDPANKKIAAGSGSNRTYTFLNSYTISKTNAYWTAKKGGVNTSIIQDGNQTPITTIGKTSKPSVSISNSNVTVSWNHSGSATSFDVYLVQSPWRWEDIKYQLSTSSTSCVFKNVNPGNYRAFVIARPNKDTEQSEWTEFTIPAPANSTVSFPSNLSLSTDKSSYFLDEPVKITPSADNATHYAISIWRGAFETGERVYANFNLSGGISFKPPKPGIYTIRADAKNSAGYISTEKTFTVAEPAPSAELPSNLSVSIDKDSYTLGDSVAITPSADNATHYAISIWKGAFETGERLYFEDNLPGSITFKPDQTGNYTIRADAKNSAGYISVEKPFSVVSGVAEETWGSWSEWSSNYVEQTPTRQVESRPIQLSNGGTEYRYGRFVDSTGSKVCWCKTYLESWSSVTGNAALQYSDWSSTQYSPNGKIWGCGFCNGDHIGVNYISKDGRAWWSQYELPGGYYYWEESRTVEPTYGTVYRYRDRIAG